MQFGDRYYEMLFGSMEKGSSVELNDITGVSEGVLWAFRSDEDGSITFTAFRKDLPFEIVWAFMQRVRSDLVGEADAIITPGE